MFMWEFDTAILASSSKIESNLSSYKARVALLDVDIIFESMISFSID